MTSFKLSSGQQIPAVGLGTWQSKAADVSKAVADALGAGYRHIDTAYNYFNEDAIGNALSQWLGVQGNSRQDLFISTKLPHVGNRPSDVRKYLDKSLARLRLDYIDLYMVHMPFGFLSDQSGDSPVVGKDGSYLLDMNTDIVAVWKTGRQPLTHVVMTAKVMESLVDEGRVRAIGVSNFNIVQLERLLVAARVPPAVNQVETHASCQQSELRAFCRRQDILVTAYSPLGSPGSRAHFKNKYNYRWCAGVRRSYWQHLLALSYLCLKVVCWSKKELLATSPRSQLCQKVVCWGKKELLVQSPRFQLCVKMVCWGKKELLAKSPRSQLCVKVVCWGKKELLETSPRSQLCVKVVCWGKKELLATSTNQRCETCLIIGGSPETYPDHMNHPVVQNIARCHNKTPAQILLKHLVQQGVAVIPKSINPARIAENIQIFDFELDVNELNQLNSLDQGEEGRIVDYNWYKGVEAHPEYPFTERLKPKIDKNGHFESNTSFIAS
uniref:NADP-dependent oxidoreductase domain-containing protein n=1 Tax=Timema monikensis TaxID=170555 RepID=A0A7R9E0K0_9NEOP|nr:unnamed protein product [Timema monikensis]